MIENPEIPSLVDLLRLRAESQPEQIAYTYLLEDENEVNQITYQDLDKQARTIGTLLQHHTTFGDRVLLLYPPGIDYIAAFFGCLYAGTIAVPIYPPRFTNRSALRFLHVAENAQATVALTNHQIMSKFEQFKHLAPQLASIRWVDTDHLTITEEWQQTNFYQKDTIAFLQYTSGSTSKPKGVILTHGNLLYNLQLIHHCFDVDASSRGVIWLPPYHDMGLIGGILQPLYGGFPVTLMSPVAFLQNPLLWLKTITEYQGTISGGPNFAYEYCVHRIPLEARAELDLSSWCVAFNGAEPIRPKTFDLFASAFEPYGFRRQSFYPCYGLAEATLIVSGGKVDKPPILHVVDTDVLSRGYVKSATGNEGQALVSSGCNLPGQSLIIVDPQTNKRCADNQIGEIWVNGPSIAQGYWQQPVKTTEAFHGQLQEEPGKTFLRTGDLGYLNNGELYVTGRIKDLIIIRGRNYYPQDIEFVAEQSHEAFRPGCSAAFTVPIDGEERIVIVQELRRRFVRSVNADEVIRAVRTAVSEQYQLQLYAVLLLKPGRVPKTSSGKIQRRLCRASFLAGELEMLFSHVAYVSSMTSPSDNINIQEQLATVSDLAEQRALLLEYLCREVAQVLRIEPTQLVVTDPLHAFGIDSLMAVELKNRIAVDLGITISMTLILDGCTLKELVERLLDRLRFHNDPKVQNLSVSLAPESHTMLSYAQQRLWFLEQLVPGSSAYNIPVAVRFDGVFDFELFSKCLNKVVERHHILHVNFAVQDGKVSQLIDEITPLDVSLLDMTDLSTIQQEEQISQIILTETQRPFDLTTDKLLRVSILKCHATKHIMLLTIHHIIADGWSMAIFWQELQALYQADLQGHSIELPHLPIQYSDYVYWYQQWLKEDSLATQLDYWRQQLADIPTILNLPTDHKRPLTPTFRGAHHRFLISSNLTDSLQQLSRQEEVTLFMTILATFQLLLSYYTRADDIVVGTDMAGRHWPHTDKLIGLFVNQLVLRTDLSGNPTFVQLLQRVRQVTLAAYDHQDVPFHKLVETLKPKRILGCNPLFQVMFVFENFPLPPLQLPELQLELMLPDSGGSPFDMSLIMSRSASGLQSELRYSTDLFEPTTIAIMAECLQTLLHTIVERPEATIQSLHDVWVQTKQQQQRQKIQVLKTTNSQKFRQAKRKAIVIE